MFRLKLFGKNQWRFFLFPPMHAHLCTRRETKRSAFPLLPACNFFSFASAYILPRYARPHFFCCSFSSGRTTPTSSQFSYLLTIVGEHPTRASTSYLQKKTISDRFKKKFQKCRKITRRILCCPGQRVGAMQGHPSAPAVTVTEP